MTALQGIFMIEGTPERRGPQPRIPLPGTPLGVMNTRMAAVLLKPRIYVPAPSPRTLDRGNSGTVFNLPAPSVMIAALFSMQTSP